jgi:hypothetical protein
MVGLGHQAHHLHQGHLDLQARILTITGLEVEYPTIDC